MTFEGCFTIKLSAKIVVFYKNDTCRRIFYPIAAGPRTLPDGNPCKSRAPQGGIRQNPARIPQVCDRSPKSSANENGINGQPAMFHRKQSAGTRQKDKFRHRKAIRRIVSRPRNLKFPGGHDAFTNYFRNFGFSTDFSTGRRVSGFRSHAEHGKRPENPVFPTNGSETAAPERRKKRKNSPTVPGNEDGADSPSPPNRQRHIQPQSQL